MTAQTTTSRQASGPFSKATLYLLLLVVLCLVAYQGSLSSPFIYDDVRWISRGERIRQDLWPLGPFFKDTLRPVWFYSLAINFKLAGSGGLDVTGYRVFNLSVHIAVALTLFGLIRRTLTLPVFGGRYDKSAEGIAFAASALWAVHPLPTQAVSYCIQRCESMMSLFMVLSLYGLVRAAVSARPVIWYAVAVMASTLGMGSKPIMIVAPLVLLIYDRVYLSKSMAELVSRRWLFYMLIAVGWTWLAVSAAKGVLTSLAPRVAEKVVSVDHTALKTVQQEESLPNTPPVAVAGQDSVIEDELNPWSYARSQPAVLLHYLRLVFWPHPLSLEYQWPISSVSQAILPCTIVVALLAGSIFMLCTRPRLGAPLVMFFLILSPTSSFMPIRHLAFEHRMYLASSIVILLVVMAVYHLIPLVSARTSWSQRSFAITRTALLVVALLSLSLETIMRNRDYQSQVSIWASVVKADPVNINGLISLAQALRGEQVQAEMRARDLASKGLRNEALRERDLANKHRTEAMQHLNRAAFLNPNDPMMLGVLGDVYSKQGEYQKAAESYRRSLEGAPNNGQVLFNLGNSYRALNNSAAAIDSYRKALIHQPGLAQARWNLGLLLFEQGEKEQGMAALHEALESRPGDFRLLADVGGHYAMQGEYKKAIEYLSRALKLAPAADQQRLQQLIDQTKSASSPR